MKCPGCGALAPDLTSMAHAPTCIHPLRQIAKWAFRGVERKPYTAPTVTDVGPPAWPSVALRVYAILRRNCDASGVNWYSPQGVLRSIQREVEKELDTETRAKLASAGFDVRGEAESPENDPPWMRDTPQVCGCVNPPRLGIGETSCPNCGGSRA